MDNLNITHVIKCDTKHIPKRIPEWMKQALVVDNGAHTFMPMLLCDDSEFALYAALWDGAPLVQYEGNFYIEARWAIENYPEVTKTFERVLRYVAENCTPKAH